MANSNEEQTQLTTKTTDNTKKEHCKTVTTAQTSYCWLIILAPVAAVMALAFALFATYTSTKLAQKNEEQHQQLQVAVLHLQEEQTSNKAIFSSTTKTQTALQNQMQTLNKNVESAFKQQRYQKNDWLLLRARYYLELAQINAHWSNNQQITIALLQQANDILRDIPEQQVLAVRQAIAKELAQLKTLPQLDITDLLSQLDAIQNVLINIPIKQPFIGIQNNIANHEANTEYASWRDRLKQSMNILEKLVIVRRNDSDIIPPLILPLHQTLMRDSIRLNLQEAEWAILQNNPAVYQLALTQALKEIKRNFDEKAAGTQALMKQLQALQQVNLVTQKPAIEESLSLLNQWIEAKKAPLADPTEGDKTK